VITNNNDDDDDDDDNDDDDYDDDDNNNNNNNNNNNTVFINSVSLPTSQRTQSASTTKNRLMLFRKMMSVYCVNHTQHVTWICGQNAEF